jgi:hypothetical protein
MNNILESFLKQFEKKFEFGTKAYMALFALLQVLGFFMKFEFRSSFPRECKDAMMLRNAMHVFF